MTHHRLAHPWPTTIPLARLAHTIARDAFPRLYAHQPFALLGLPSEVGVALNTGKPGASHGPAAFRAALSAYGVQNALACTLPPVWDAGDVEPPTAADHPSLQAQLLAMHTRVALAASEIASTGALPIAIGGGHDLTCAFVRGVVSHARSNVQSKRTNAPLAVLNFDAHFDVRDTLGSGMPFRTINEELAPIAMGIVGPGAFVNTQEHASYFTTHAHGSLLHDAEALSRWLHDLPTNCLLACSFDLDVLDASHAPGVSARNPAGLSVREAAAMLSLVAQDSRLLCLDFMELCPPRDEPAWPNASHEAGRTARAAAHLFLTAIAARREKLVPSKS